MFNRWVGTNPFSGTARSTAMGSTHLLNSIGSSNARFNPANLTLNNPYLEINLQIDRSSVFERRSIQMRDNWGEYFLYGDYVANEFSYYGFSGGISGATKIRGGKAGFGIHHAPLAHFKYHYSEEVRGEHDGEDGDYISSDPIVGYQNLITDGTIIVSSFGGSIQINVASDISLSFGSALNFIHSAEISDRVEVDTLYFDVTNLSTYPDVQQTDMIPKSDFLTLSTKLNLKSYIEIAASWESNAELVTKIFDWSIDSTNGLLQYWDDNTYEDSTFYAVKGMNYVKPEIRSFAFNYMADATKTMSISFELNEFIYNKHLILKNYRIYKFGFEYITQMGTPIRGGLTYQTSKLSNMSPISMFTFGTGKTIGNVIIDAAGTYCFQSFNYPDLFQVEGDIRYDYDLVRESQLQLQLALTYRF